MGKSIFTVSLSPSDSLTVVGGLPALVQEQQRQIQGQQEMLECLGQVKAQREQVQPFEVVQQTQRALQGTPNLNASQMNEALVQVLAGDGENKQVKPGNSQIITSHHRLEQYGKNPNPYDQERITQELRRKIQDMLHIARSLPLNLCLDEIRRRLLSIQQYCQSVEKVFIFVEQEITCSQHKLQGSDQDTAILFRGPNEDASVAICITHKGSLLYRNSSPWLLYKDAGDVGNHHNSLG